MRARLDPFSFLMVSIAGWMNQHQHRVIEYLIEENRVLREQMGNRRVRFSDDQRRRLAAKAKKLGRKLLAQITTIVTPRNVHGLAPDVDCPEIRWQLLPTARTTENGDGDFQPRYTYGGGKPILGLPTNPGRLSECGPCGGTHHNRRHFEEARYRAGSGAESQDDLERLSEAPLGPDCGHRFLHGRDVDPYGSATLDRPVLHGPFDSTCGTRRHREVSQWILDEPDRPQSNGCG